MHVLHEQACRARGSTAFWLYNPSTESCQSCLLRCISVLAVMDKQPHAGTCSLSRQIGASFASACQRS